ncbi:uncharacterized protein LY89DRAFT_688230 [Mollisia scopiformis]|uniref:Uncharacterized protein n=1 Tax=Mollisia scopiformis TaxID=149040 RepID=A0A194WY03_MOLSC|nr:uncharacterized protein LY89DRAFT_688230 [Mollisia scopiformis]KUJ12569.1 hypothetical protein LY89DRAFT_688230 [Mollisia scopiformis]
MAQSSFYTLSSNQPDRVKDSAFNFEHKTKQSPLTFPSTHDTSRSDCHMNSLSHFVEALDQVHTPKSDQNISKST